MKRSVYLNMKTIEQAREVFLAAFDWAALRRVEQLATADALGRVTAQPVFSRTSSPAYHAAAMDGFAVRARDTFGASEERPVRLSVGRAAHPVNTGQALPEGTDAVIMIEHVHQPGPGELELTAPAFPWQHVRRVGEDIVAGELVLPHHHRLGAVDVAALLTGGVFRLEVLTRPRVAIIATGDELVDWQQAEHSPPQPGQILETNSVLLAGLVREAGGLPEVLPRQPDALQAVRDAIDAAVDSDAQLVLVNAGASAGTADFTVHAIAELGEVLVHGIKVMPGKPTIVGRVRGKPVLGTPGYPVSAWVCHDLLVRAALATLLGQPEPQRPQMVTVAARRLPSKLGNEELLRVHLGRVGQQVVATPLKRGAGTITSLTRADGLLRIGPDSEGLEAGAGASAELLRPTSAVDRTLMVVGSHDVTLDLMADWLPRVAPQVRLSASNVGSLAGLLALRDGRSHLGGTHLLDPETGEYNVSYVARYLPDLPVRLVTLAHREQGLMLRPGNPQGIGGLQDLTRDGVRFVNRQAGSGTRVLLDYQLQRAGIASDRIEGYTTEEYTHMAVAVQVASGGADAGLGILAAARALELDFVPVATERYDLCIPEAFVDDPRLRALLAVLAQPEFRRAVQALGGYDVGQMGQLAWSS
jgi:putative molybdopterin biosynthesis protein